MTADGDAQADRGAIGTAEDEPIVVDAILVEADPAACSLCAGPAIVCGRAGRCPGGCLDVVERRWVTAVRLVHAGLCLTPTAAALWGGALLRLARLLTCGGGAAPALLPELVDPLGGLSARLDRPRGGLSRA